MVSLLKVSLFSALTFYLALACGTSGNDNSSLARDSAFDETSAYDTPYNSAYTGNSSDQGAINCGYDAGQNRVVDTFTVGIMAAANNGKVLARAINCRADANIGSPKVTSFRKDKTLTFARMLKLDERGVCWFNVSANHCWVAGRPSMLQLH